MLKSRAGHAVTDRLQRISRSVGKKVKDNRHLRKLTERYGKPPLSLKLEAAPPPLRPELGPPKPPAAKLRQNERKKAGSRRRLLAIAKGGRVLLSEGQQDVSGAGVVVDGQEHAKERDVHGNATLQKGETALQGGNVSNVDAGSTAQEQVGNVTLRVKNRVARNGSRYGDLKDLSNPSLRAVLGVALAVLSSVASRAASGARQRIVLDVGDSSSVSALVFLACASLLFPFVISFWVLARMRDESYSHALLNEIVPCGAFLGLGILAFPLLLQAYRRHDARRSGIQSQRGGSKVNHVGSSVHRSSSLLADAAVPNGVTMYSYVFVSIIVLRKLSLSAFGFQETLTFSSFFAAFMLLCISMLESSQAGGQLDSSMRERVMNSSSGDLSALVVRGTVHRLRQMWKSVSSSLSGWFSHIRDLMVHARSNKASWQVLNFLVLQFGMATVELIYATMTHATGLISISADNFFCCVALAIGLLAIRVTTRKPTNVYSYGFSRFESVCGFANGIMLIYVAVLIVLEAFERLNESENLAAGHTFTVCLFGMTGNILGLYFFPPESRRENHNVQGIYLHIWANTLAFASMAISTAITAAVPAWEPIDMVTATLVAVSVIALAIPLLIRSGRLLVLLVPVEKAKALTSLRNRLNNIDGVVKVSGLRVWNLTPNCLVASVRLEVAIYYKGQDVEVLYKARSLFASMGVPASQCTIQISRVESENKAVVFFHKRTRSGFGDTGIDLEALSISRETKE